MSNKNGAENAKNEGWTFEQFRSKCIAESARFGSDRKAAKHYGVNSGHFTQVIVYRKESKKLRRAMGCPKNAQCGRFTCQDPTGQLTRNHDSQRGDMSRSEYQAYLLRMDREYFSSKNYGELPY